MNKRFIELDENNKVVGAVETWKCPDPSYIENYDANIGDIMQEDGSFLSDEIEARINELNKELIGIKKQKEKYDLMVITKEEYEPYRLRAVEIYDELATLE